MSSWRNAAALLLLLAPARSGDADWQLITCADGLPQENVRALCRFREQLWVGTDDGLALYEHGHWRSWTAREGLPWPAIHAIDVDPQTHDVWLGTWGGGLVRFSAGRFERFDQFTSGLAGDLVFAVRALGPRIWAATNEGLCAFDWRAGTWDLHLERRATGAEPVVSSIAAVQGQVYASAWCDAPWRIDASAEEPDQRLDLADVTSNVACAQESLWVAGATRLWRHASEGSWTSRALPAEFPGLASCFAVAEDGAVWLGAEQCLMTLASWDADDWQQSDLGTDFGRIQCIAVSGGEVWAGTSHGLLRGRAGSKPVQSPRSEHPRAAHAPLLGLIGPFGRTVTLPGTPASAGAERPFDDIAIELATQACPSLTVCRELPGLSPYAWGTPEDELLGLMRKHDPIALIGSIAPQGCVSSAVSLVVETPWMNTSLAPPSAVELASPWIFRCPINDPREQALVLDQAFDSLHCSRPLLLRTGEPFADLHLRWWTLAAAARGTPVVAECTRPAAGGDFGALLGQLRGESFDVLLTWSDAASSAELVRRLRAAGIEQPVLASAEAACATFLERVGADPGVVLAPSPCAHLLDMDGRLRFAGHYRPADARATQRTGPAPISWASYDAARHVLEAFERGGKERESLRRILGEGRHARLARLLDGRWR